MTRRFFASGSKLRGVLSQEDENLDPGSDGAAGTEEALATLAAEGEANEAEAEAAESEAMVENAMDGVVALEELRMEIWAANQNGGLNRGGAAIARRHANLILRHMLGEKEPLPMPSMESFGGIGNQISSGVLTMESIGDKIKSTWAEIIKWFKKIREKVMGWINKVFGAGENLVKRAAAIIKRADALKGGEPSTKKFDGASLWKSLAVDGTLDASTLTTGIGVVSKLADGMVDVSTKSNEDIEDVLEALGKVDKNNVTDVLAMARKDFANGNTELAAKTPVKDKTPMPGNVSMRVPEVISIGKPDQRIEGWGLKTNDQKAKDSIDIPTLKKDEIVSIATIVKNIGESLTNSRKVADNSKKTYDKFESFLKKEAANPAITGNSDDKEATGPSQPGKPMPHIQDDAGGDYSKLIKIIRESAPLIDGPIKTYSGYVLRTGRAALDYCDSSISNNSAS